MVGVKILRNARGTESKPAHRSLLLEQQIRIINESGLFEVDYYTSQAGKSILGLDPVSHYLLSGEKEGLAPNTWFNPSDYLEMNPDVRDSGMSPFIHFIVFGMAENRQWSKDTLLKSSDNQPLDTSEKIVSFEDAAEADLYSRIAASKYFDAEYYIRTNKLDVAAGEALKHYFAVGERLGKSPSPYFTPAYYLSANSDVREHGLSPLRHFFEYGMNEGRKGVEFEGLLEGLVRLDADRSTIVVVTHETSATGAPILAYNIVDQLKSIFNLNVVVISWRGGGVLSSAFKDRADLFVAPDADRHFSPSELSNIVDHIAGSISPRYAIANSGVVSKIALLLQAKEIPVVGLIHEFSSLLGDPSMREYFDKIEEIVFPAEIVRNSIFRDHPRVKARRTHVIPQGRSFVPASAMGSASRDRPFGSDYLTAAVLKWAKQPDTFLIAGLGTMEWRKGMDRFLSTAYSLKQQSPTFKYKFVWIGGYHAGSYEASMYAEEQLEASGLQEEVLFLPSTKDIETIYKMIDVLLVVPRLDPFPNVAIDAMAEGIPVIVCDGGTGIAEIMKEDEALRKMIVPFFDASQVAAKLNHLLSDELLLAEYRAKFTDFADLRFNMREYVLKLNSLI